MADGKTHNMIDYIMIANRFRSSVNLAKTRTFLGADIGSDHDLVMTSLTLRLKNLKKKRNAKVCYDLEKLRDSQILDKFQAGIGGRFAPLLAAEMETEDHRKSARSSY